MTYQEFAIGTLRGPHHIRHLGRALRYQFGVKTGNGWVFFSDTIEKRARQAAEAYLADMKKEKV
ncbi:hypothetical protein [Magnetospirillum molischianum]|uniref:hypothetical protein n=1 Tax=Magnetospirillum molischianum TaxID=1083 RepID=UPI0002EE5100|nr:hypothetical protein [Magnetospirillum molischianum]